MGDELLDFNKYDSRTYPDVIYCPFCKEDVQTTKYLSGIVCRKCRKMIVDTYPWIKIPVTIEEVIRESE